MISFADDIDLQQVGQQFIWRNEWKFRAMEEWIVDKLCFKIYCQQFNSSTSHQSILSTEKHKMLSTCQHRILPTLQQVNNK
jgi:hypothetical protein